MVTRSRKAVAKSGVVKAKKLCRASLKKVEENATEIVQALYDSTIAGHVLSAKLLVDLGEGNVDSEDATPEHPLRSLALELDQQPEWKGETDEPKT